MEKSDCRNAWEAKNPFYYCPIHNEYFKKECPKYDPLASDGMRVGGAKKRSSQINTAQGHFKHKSLDKQQPVLDKHHGRLDKKYHNKVSKYGNKYSNPLTVCKNEDFVAIDKLFRDGVSQSDIARRFHVSRQRISQILRRLDSGEPSSERLHNFSLTFDALVPYDYVDLPEVRLRGHSYKVFKNGEFFVQVFHDSVLVRFLRDVFGLRIHSSVASAIQRIQDFLKVWNVFHIQFAGFRISSGHNEFNNSPIAKDIASKGQRIRYRDHSDGKMRTTIDFSRTEHNPSGAPMFEHEHSKHFQADSEKWEGILDDVATDKYLPLHDVKFAIENLIRIQESSLEAQRRSAENEEYYAKNRASHVDAIKTLARAVEKLDSRIERLGDVQKSRKMSKGERARKFLHDFGW